MSTVPISERVIIGACGKKLYDRLMTLSDSVFKSMFEETKRETLYCIEDEDLFDQQISELFQSGEIDTCTKIKSDISNVYISTRKSDGSRSFIHIPPVRQLKLDDDSTYYL